MSLEQAKFERPPDNANEQQESKPTGPEQDKAQEKSPEEKWPELGPGLLQIAYGLEIEKPLDTPDGIPLSEEEQGAYDILKRSYDVLKENYVEINNRGQYLPEVEVEESKPGTEEWVRTGKKALLAYDDNPLEIGRGNPSAFSNEERSQLFKLRLEVRNFIENAAQKYGVVANLSELETNAIAENIRRFKKESAQYVVEATEERAQELAAADIEKAYGGAAGQKNESEAAFAPTMFFEAGKTISDSEILQAAEEKDLETAPPLLRKDLFDAAAGPDVEAYNTLVNEFLAKKDDVMQKNFEKQLAAGVSLEDLSKNYAVPQEVRKELLAAMEGIRKVEQGLLDKYREGEKARPSVLESAKAEIARRRGQNSGSTTAAN